MNNANKKIAIVAGARPNFMKVAPFCHELKKQKINYFLVNTGQHFNKRMAANFFKEFKIKPHYNFKPNRESIVKQFNDIKIKLEKVFKKENPNVVVVVGDVNSTLAGAQVANKLGIKLAHIEAGLRSYNKKMPEERNRVLTDQLSNLLFVTQPEGISNLKKEKIKNNVFFVGNIMIDTAKIFLPRIKKSKEDFYFCTLHRAENVDDKKIFNEILDAMEIIAQDKRIYLPLHPRTKKMVEKFKLLNKINKIFIILPPLSYRESLYYQKNAQLILTDSGGIQEEASYLGIPCLTLRTETERPITVKLGTNTIAGVTKKSILKAYKNKNLNKKKIRIPKWDGKTSKRIIKILLENI